MKTNLLEAKFDLSEILYNIRMFEAINGDYPEYIVMNRKTGDSIKIRYKLEYVARADKETRADKEKRIDEIFGIPIAYNDNLQFGIIDIV